MCMVLHYYLVCTHTADILVSGWLYGKPVTFDLTLTYPLKTPLLSCRQAEVGVKHAANYTECFELSWVCI